MPYEKFNIMPGKPEETLKLWARKFEYLFNKNLNVDNVVSTGILTLADLVSVDDTGGYYASSNNTVEDALQQIGSTLQNIPAGNVKIVDSGSYYASTSVEGALQEVASTLRNNPSSNIYVDDTGGYYGGNHDLEGILQQIGSTITNLPTSNLNFAFISPLESTSTNIILNYSTVNLKVNASSQLDTIQDISTNASPVFGNLTVTSTIQSGTAKFGNSSHYSQFEADGTLVFNGDATVFDDANGSALELKVTGVGLTVNPNENTLDYSTAADLNDYGYDNFQFSHKRKLGTAIYPHAHWVQKEGNTPNFLVRYRWQVNGQSHTTTWSNYPLNTNAFTYTAGSLNQITYGAGISAPSTDGISGILQLKFFRDNANISAAFATTDLYSTTANVMFVDIHNEIDTVGSRQQYAK